MSFNHLDVARAAGALKEILVTSGESLEGVELLEFPLRVSVPDVNIGLKFKSGVLVFSLRQPWVGVFFGPRRWWKVCSGPGPAFGPLVQGQKLVDVWSSPQDRRLFLKFNMGFILRVDLFPTRPNWVLLQESQGDEKTVQSWHPESGTTAIVTAIPAFEVPSEVSAQSWFQTQYEKYRNARETWAFESHKQKALAQVTSKLKKNRALQKTLQASLTEAQQAAQVKQQGELLKTVLYQYPKEKKLKEIEIGDVKLKLDPKLTLAENAERFFSKYKKLQRTEAEVSERLRILEKKILACEQEKKAFESVQGIADLKLPVHTVPPSQKKSEKKWQQAGLKHFQSQEGLLIWVGRNHKENEELVMKLARGNDLWFHVKGRPGAHVIVQVPAKKTASLETLLDAATIAAHYSKTQIGEKTEVDYTFRKNVKRVSGKNDGFLVHYNQSKALVVLLEKNRLQRILNTEGAKT